MTNKVNIMADQLNAAKVVTENGDNLDETGQGEVRLYVTGDISTQFDHSMFL